jgi:hypothetical protein
MARKRLNSPEFYTHKLLFTAEKKSRLPIRVAFSGLWTQSDRRGIFRWKPDDLQLAILPYDKCEMSKVLDVLAEYGFVVRYEVDGRSYGIIPTFTRWQTFHIHERPSKDPAPPETWLNTVLARCQHGANTPVAVTVTGTSTVAEVAPHGEQRSVDAERAADGAAALGTRQLVKIVGTQIGANHKRRIPPPPGIHAALATSDSET